MSDLSVTKTENGIEFYVSEDGTQTGMSISGLARCCGVHQTTISKFLASSESMTSAAGKTLKTLQGEVLTPMTNDKFPNVKVINAEACAAIITYYAFESKNAKNDTAKTTLSKFSTVGIDKWIKNVVGFDEKHQDVMATLSLIYDELKELKTLAPLAKNYIKVKDGVKTEFPGLDKILESLEEDYPENLLEGASVTLSDWLLTRKVKLTRGGYCAFGRMVSETYKTMRRDMPNKGNRKKANGKWSMNVRLYNEKDFPILESALKQFMSLD